ncbi:37S ribosomal protein subunit sws2, mitochondrial [Sphaceloma murrayae]|uniref:37S ribosomal protein subunit sws2, mitochondrial n=1 Tax=Sphaceloma murrayae TaxID=2082308 RepID=A0A2K1R2K2_9PEZI|nr:37S ribosomal protein subunit sws2, mitochondrial [Sphaceloma murrayae]
MVLLFGNNFPEWTLVKRALQSFYGVGPKVSEGLMARFHIHKRQRLGALGDGQINGLAADLSGMTIDNDLRRQMVGNIKRLRDMGSYRGKRHAMNLPVRGQNTRGQIKTAKLFNKIDRKR